MFLVKLVKDPLVHFFAVGVALFAFVSLVAPTAQQDQILVDRQALLTFLQYRAKAFEPAAAASMLDKMPENERSQLISGFIREEALYREAMALGLDDGDYVIRKRMIQKLEFMLEASRLPFVPNAKERHDYYIHNKHDYSVPASATFTHVFISSKVEGPEQAQSKAAQLLSQLRYEKASFTDALKYGDRFLYHSNYVQQPFENVRNHFGVRAANSIFSERFPLNEWHGPILSSYGAHLIFIKERVPSEILPFSRVQTKLMEDMARYHQRAHIDALTSDIVDANTIVLAPNIIREPTNSSSVPD